MVTFYNSVQSTDCVCVFFTFLQKARIGDNDIAAVATEAFSRLTEESEKVLEN